MTPQELKQDLNHASLLEVLRINVKNQAGRIEKDKNFVEQIRRNKDLYDAYSDVFTRLHNESKHYNINYDDLDTLEHEAKLLLNGILADI